MTFSEQGLVFESGGERLVGVAALPESPSVTAVLILVGGPQYRVGSHRQFTLLARHLAQQGYATLRFDYTGMGDSEGEPSSFDQANGDVSAAIAALRACSPGIERIVLWGLCDAASMALIYAPTAPEVVGIVLLNPWVHQGEYLPRMRLQQYRNRLLDFNYWGRLLRHPEEVAGAMGRLALTAWVLLRPNIEEEDTSTNFVDVMRDALQEYSGEVQVILSENDLTASEFSALVEGDKRWQLAMGKPRVELQRLAGADHTFSRREWRISVEELTTDWLSRF